MMKSWPKSLVAIAMIAAFLSALVSGCSKEPTPETTEAPAANATPPAATPEPSPAPAASSGKAEPGGYVPSEEEKVAPAPDGTKHESAWPADTKTGETGTADAPAPASETKSE